MRQTIAGIVTVLLPLSCFAAEPTFPMSRGNQPMEQMQHRIDELERRVAESTGLNLRSAEITDPRAYVSMKQTVSRKSRTIDCNRATAADIPHPQARVIGRAELLTV